jgi:hypothetical protein
MPKAWGDRNSELYRTIEKVTTDMLLMAKGEEGIREVYIFLFRMLELEQV